MSQYDRATAEEKIWFATPNLRFSRLTDQKLVMEKVFLTASFSSEIRSLSNQSK